MKSAFTKYLLLSIALIVIGEVTKNVIHFNELLHNSLAEQLTSAQIENYFELQEKWQWVGYVFIPIYLLLKTSIIATILYIGTFFFSKKTVTFKQLWAIAIHTEFLFLLVPILKMFWFYFFQTNYTLEDIQCFYPLSALNIIGFNGLESWLMYPLQTLNLFELGYVLLLAYFIGKLVWTEKQKQKPMEVGFKIVMSSYVPALLLWVVLVMFLTLSMS